MNGTNLQGNVLSAVKAGKIYQTEKEYQTEKAEKQAEDFVSNLKKQTDKAISTGTKLTDKIHKENAKALSIDSAKREMAIKKAESAVQNSRDTMDSFREKYRQVKGLIEGVNAGLTRKAGVRNE